MIKASYTVMCKNDVSKELSLAEILANEKVEKAIKSEFAKGLRNLVISHKEEAEVFLKTEKEVFEILKRYFDTKITQKELAEEYKVSRPTIALIVIGTNWKNCYEKFISEYNKKGN